MNRYAGRRVLITGGGSGIGQATVLRVLSEGATVVAADISLDGLTDTATRAKEAGLADNLTTMRVDTSEESSVRDSVADAIGHLGGLDTLVNAAGILRSAHTHETSLADFTRVLQVNLVGTFLVTREALPALMEGTSPAVVNLSSTSATFAHPYMAAYSASKGGIQSMTHALASEYSKQGIRFVAVAPGSISSGMTDGSGASQQSSGPDFPVDADADLLVKLSPAIGEGFAPPEDVASVVALLGSTDGAFITGTEIRVDGGTHF